MADLNTLLSQLEKERKNGGIDYSTYNYLKNQFYSADKQYNNELTKNYNEYKNTNPFETAFAKSIRNDYQARGYQAMNNTYADSAAINGGNVDSFATANALRQQLDFTNQATDKILSEHENKQKNIMDYLNEMKKNAEGYYGKADNLATVDRNFKSDINNKISNVYSQLNANQQAEKNRQNQLQLQREAASQKAANLKLQSQLSAQQIAKTSATQIAQLQAERDRLKKELERAQELINKNSTPTNPYSYIPDLSKLRYK